MRSAVVLLVFTGALLSGCELIADFDRSKLVTDAGIAGSGGGDGGEMPAEDAATIDSSFDNPDEDAGGSDDEDAGL